MARKKSDKTKAKNQINSEFQNTKIEKEENARRLIKSIPDESTFDNRISLYDYSYSKSCRVDYNPYDYGFDFGSISLEDF